MRGKIRFDAIFDVAKLIDGAVNDPQNARRFGEGVVATHDPKQQMIVRIEKIVGKMNVVMKIDLNVATNGLQHKTLRR